jgi:hypothetical protein
MSPLFVRTVTLSSARVSIIKLPTISISLWQIGHVLLGAVMSMAITGTRRLAAIIIAVVASAGSLASAAVAAAPAVAAGPGAGSPASVAAPASDDTAPCSFAKVSACQSTDPAIKTYVKFSQDTTDCTFDIAVDWGNGGKVQHVFFTSPTDGLHFLAAHHYRYRTMPMTFTISVQGTVTAGFCGFNSGTLSFTLLTCTNAELSGPSWAGRFLDSRLVGALSGTFRKDVSAFVAAMRHAGVKVRPISTLRPTERAFLMHYSWLVANRKLSPLKVPHFHADRHHKPVSICWVHLGAHGANLRASVTAARKLAAALGVASMHAAPPLTSLRTEGLAIVMSTAWTSRKITITNAAGQAVTIRSTPHNGLNKGLIAVGATYGVIHFLNPKRAMDDWSVNGH